MLSKTEREFLQDEFKRTGKNRAALEKRIKKKTEQGIADLALICKNQDKLNPKTDNSSWKNIEIFCKSKSL